MSADNCNVVLASPKADGSGTEYRWATNCSMSLIEELETHWFAPEQERDFLGAVFSPESVPEEAFAFDEMRRSLDEGDWTEYGDIKIWLSYPFGTLRDIIPEPPLPEGACPFCSSSTTTVSHGGSRFCENDPDNPEKIVRDVLQAEFNGINVHRIARVAVEALQKAGKL